MKNTGLWIIVAICLPGQFACTTWAQPVPDREPTAVDLSLDEQIANLPGLTIRAIDDPVHGGQIRWLEAGQAQGEDLPVLLVHGLGSEGMRDYYPLLEELTQTRRVLLLDLPGFARSSKANKHYRPDSYAALLAHLIKTEAGSRVDLVGHSMGGATAVELAGHHPQLVRRLVLMDAATILHREALVASFAPERMANSARLFLETYRFLEPDFSRFLKTAESRKRQLGGDPKRIVALSFILHNFSPALSGITAPTLILWGRADTIAPLRTGHSLHSRIANSKLVILEGIKHEPQLEDPKRVLLEMQAHLKAKEPDYRQANPGPGKLTMRSALCDGLEGEEYEGDFDTIEIRNCDQVVLKNVRANRILIDSSRVEMLNPRVTGNPDSPVPALLVKSSTLVVTGGRLEGQPALRLEGSNADIAGLNLQAARAPAWETDDSRTIFSVTEVRAGDSVSHLHGERY